MSEVTKYVLLWVGFLLFALADWFGVIDPDRVWYGVIVLGIYIYKNERDIEGLRQEITNLNNKM